MIEVPRAALIADQIAEHAEFFSFGTNDLTQMTFGYSRDDVGKFLPVYLEKKLLPDDPFAVLDQEGVGELVRIGIERGRQTRPDLKVGICGEHGGEPSSVEFCHRVGMNYVSCSPFMVPIAWLAAAQAEIKEPRDGAAQGRRQERQGGADEAVKLSGARILLECLKREGVDLIFGLPGGAVLPIYDALYDFEGCATSWSARRPPPATRRRATRGRPGKVGVCLVTSGPAAHEPGDRAAGRPDGLDPDRGLHRAGADAPDRQRRLPGGRQRRHHPLGHQAQLPGEGRQGPGPDHQGGVPHRGHRPPGAGARRPAQGHPGQGVGASS